jgi:hypothetical protein
MYLLDVDAAGWIRRLAVAPLELSSSERELFFETHKKIVDPLRDSCRIILSVAEQASLKPQQRVWATTYACRLEQLFLAACNEVIELIDKHLLPRTKCNINRTLFWTMYVVVGFLLSN